VGNADSGWTKTMFENCSDHMSLVSEHLYCQERGSLRAHTALVANAIKHIADLHRQMRKALPAVQAKNIRIAMDEWNYWYGPHPFGELGTRYFLKDALGIARGLHEYYRNSDIIFMANYAQTVNVIGCIKTNKTAAEMETTGLVLEMYRKRYGVTPVRVSGAPEPLDVAAAWTQDGRTLTVGVVNPANARFKLRLDLKGARLAGKGRAWEIAGNDPKLYNDPGQPRRVDIVEKEVRGASRTLEIAPISATLFALPAKE
jgi:alpha-N-arabinofuranosidase